MLVTMQSVSLQEYWIIQEMPLHVMTFKPTSSIKNWRGNDRVKLLSLQIFFNSSLPVTEKN